MLLRLHGAVFLSSFSSPQSSPEPQKWHNKTFFISRMYAHREFVEGTTARCRSGEEASLFPLYTARCQPRLTRNFDVKCGNVRVPFTPTKLWRQKTITLRAKKFERNFFSRRQRNFAVFLWTEMFFKSKDQTKEEKFPWRLSLLRVFAGHFSRDKKTPQVFCFCQQKRFSFHRDWPSDLCSKKRPRPFVFAKKKDSHFTGIDRPISAHGCTGWILDKFLAAQNGLALKDRSSMPDDGSGYIVGHTDIVNVDDLNPPHPDLFFRTGDRWWLYSLITPTHKTETKIHNRVSSNVHGGWTCKDQKDICRFSSWSKNPIKHDVPTFSRQITHDDYCCICAFVYILVWIIQYSVLLCHQCMCRAFLSS